jgi:hypothetical protein
LRHTFQTIGDEAGDFIAVRQIMGYTFSNDISAVYRERVSDKRLLKVTGPGAGTTAQARRRADPGSPDDRAGNN